MKLKHLDALKKCTDKYKNGYGNKRIFIFGAGELGKQIADVLQWCGLLTGFIDNDQYKQGSVLYGVKIISPQYYIDNINGENTLIVISVQNKYYLQIEKQLEEFGQIKSIDYISGNEYEKILRCILFYYENKIYIPTIQISLTERCTLKCKKCAHACNYVNGSKEDLLLDSVKSTIDLFFKYVDYVHEFVLIGGEPFLYGNLLECIEYLGWKYKKKIGVLSITTNGTIIPNSDILETCKQYDVTIRISNYLKTLSYLENKIIRLTNLLDKYEIRYFLEDKESTWVDYGFDYVDRKATPQELEKIFDECWTACHEIRNHRFYFCVMARSVSENMNRGIGLDDYLDLNAIDVEGGKSFLFAYAMGYSEKGYLDMCNYCHGKDSINYPIEAAVQMK